MIEVIKNVISNCTCTIRWNGSFTESTPGSVRCADSIRSYSNHRFKTNFIRVTPFPMWLWYMDAPYPSEKSNCQRLNVKNWTKLIWNPSQNTGKGNKNYYTIDVKITEGGIQSSKQNQLSNTTPLNSLTTLSALRQLGKHFNIRVRLRWAAWYPMKSDLW